MRACIWLNPEDLEIVERIADGWAKTPRGFQRTGLALSQLVQLGIDRLFEYPDELHRKPFLKELLDEGLRIYKSKELI